MAKGGNDNHKDACASLLAKVNQNYVEDRVYLNYIPPPLSIVSTSKAIFSQGEVEEWLSRMNEVLEDLIWLLELPYHKFWSQFAFDCSITAFLNSYIQNTPRPYELEEFCDAINGNNSRSIQEAQDKVHALVLAVYSRLSNYDSLQETTTPLISSEFGALIYDKFIFDIPTIFDVCLVYGRSNHSEVSTIVSAVFTNQKLYLNDLDEAVVCATKSLKEIMQRSRDFVSITDNSNSSTHKGTISLTPLLDIMNYLLDVIFSVSAFIEFYPSACGILLKYKFVSLLGDMYNSTVPLLYSHTAEMCLLMYGGNDCDESRKLKRKLRILREEMLKTYSLIVAYLVSESIKCKSDNDEGGAKKCIGNFLDAWYDCLPFDVFVRDYNQVYSAQKDFLMLKEVSSSEVEHDKITFIMESVLSHAQLSKKSNQMHVPSKKIDDTSSTVSKTVKNEEFDKSKHISDIELQCRISSVNDILPDVEVNVIKSYLIAMDYSSEKVIDAILKDSIDGIPLTDKRQPKVEDTYINHRVNVFDGDEFDIMINDQIDMSKVHLGKKREQYKGLRELIDDKSHRVELADKYSRLGIVTENETPSGDLDTYDDEYDDTYDENDVNCRRTFVTPRVLREVILDSSEDSVSEESEETEGAKTNDQFVQNPADVREKMKQRHLAMRATKGPNIEKDVSGKPKGEGQDHATQLNRQRKNANKAVRANHHRKNRSLKKQQQGMF